MKNIQNIISFSLFLLICCSCSNEANIKRDFNYEVTVEKYHQEVNSGEIRELLFHIESEGDYKAAEYSFEYFVRSGEGQIFDESGNELRENIRYEITDSILKLNYKVLSPEAHKIEFLIHDTFGNSKELEINLTGIE